MNSTSEQPPERADLLYTLRNLAERGKGVRELVRCVQAELGLKNDALLPVLWYFMKAFHLPLGEVLPIREWLGTDNDEEIDAIVLPAIQRAKEKWSAQE